MEQYANQYGPVELWSCFYSTTLEEIVADLNKTMYEFDGIADTITLTRELTPNGKFVGEFSIKADDLSKIFLLLDSLLYYIEGNHIEDDNMPTGEDAVKWW